MQRVYRFPCSGAALNDDNSGVLTINARLCRSKASLVRDSLLVEEHVHVITTDNLGRMLHQLAARCEPTLRYPIQHRFAIPGLEITLQIRPKRVSVARSK